MKKKGEKERDKFISFCYNEISLIYFVWKIYFQSFWKHIVFNKEADILTQLIITKMGSHVSKYDHRACPCSSPIPRYVSICFCGAELLMKYAEVDEMDVKGLSEFDVSIKILLK